MTQEFIPYQEALELKELGFNEPCLGWYSDKNIRISGTDGCVISFIPKNSLLGEDMISAPLYQQAFRWFRKKYQKDISINTVYSRYNKILIRNYGGVVDSESVFTNIGFYETYEEAELACLRKLIELVKSKV